MWEMLIVAVTVIICVGMGCITLESCTKMICNRRLEAGKEIEAIEAKVRGVEIRCDGARRDRHEIRDGFKRLQREVNALLRAENEKSRRDLDLHGPEA